ATIVRPRGITAAGPGAERPPMPVWPVGAGLAGGGAERVQVLRTEPGPGVVVLAVHGTVVLKQQGTVVDRGVADGDALSAEPVPEDVVVEDGSAVHGFRFPLRVQGEGAFELDDRR